MKHLLALPGIAALAAFGTFFAAPSSAEAAPSCLTSEGGYGSIFMAINNCNYDLRIQYKSADKGTETIVLKAGGDSTFIIAPLGTQLSTCNMTANRNCKPSLNGGSEADSGSAAGSAANNATRNDDCIAVETSHGSMFLVNNCGYTLRGNYRSDSGRTGGFGLIKPGKHEIIAVKPGDTVNLRWCNNDAQRGCTPGKP